jgi:hypothetical protein
VQQRRDGKAFVAASLKYQRRNSHEMSDIRNRRCLTSLAFVLFGGKLKSAEEAVAEFDRPLRSPWWRLWFQLLLLPAPRKQIRPDERLQVPIEHTVHVANFHLGSMIFNQPIWLLDIRTILRPEIDIKFRVLDFLRGLAFLLHLELV